MSGTKRKIYWDTGIYCAWLSEERANQKYLPAIRELLKEAGNGKVVIMTSVITLAEILECKYEDAVYKRFQKTFNPYSHVKIDVDTRVAEQASLYRGHYNSKEPPIKVRTPDAIHMATGALYEADEIWTFDEGMLRFDGNLMGENIIIRRPNTFGNSEHLELFEA